MVLSKIVLSKKWFIGVKVLLAAEGAAVVFGSSAAPPSPFPSKDFESLPGTAAPLLGDGSTQSNLHQRIVNRVCYLK